MLLTGIDMCSSLWKENEGWTVRKIGGLQESLRSN